MKNNKFLPAVLGALLIVSGFGYLFESLNISPKFWILPVFGMALLFIGVMNNLKTVRDIGIGGLVLGISLLAEILFFSPLYARVIGYTAISVLLFIYATLHKKTWLWITGALSFAFAVYSLLLVLNISLELVTAYTLIAIATFFVVIFIFKNEKFGYIPLLLGVLFYLLAVSCFLLEMGVITQKISDVITSALLILTGVAVLVFVFKPNEKEK